MPIIKSARKRVKITRKATLRNAKTKRILKTAIKSFRSALKSTNSKANETFNKAQSALDKAAKKGLMHKNKAARKKRQLAKLAKDSAGTNKRPISKKAVVKTSKPRTNKSVAKKSVKKS